jgi:hypothetical protein
MDNQENKMTKIEFFKGEVPPAYANGDGLHLPLGLDESGQTKSIDILHTPDLLVAGNNTEYFGRILTSLASSILPSSKYKLTICSLGSKESDLTDDVKKAYADMVVRRMDAFIVEKERRQKDESKPIDSPAFIMFIEEFSLLMRYHAKEFEDYLRVLDGMNALGMHLIVSTNHPSADVITGRIKDSFPAQLAFKVNNQVNSMIIMDHSGAQRLNENEMILSLA